MHSPRERIGKTGKELSERAEWRDRIEEVRSFWKEVILTVSDVVKGKEKKH